MTNLSTLFSNLSKNWSSLFDFLIKFIPYVVNTFHWLRNRIKWRGISEDARKIAFAINSFSWISLQQAAPTIRNVGMIERPEIRQIQNIWESSDTPLLLHGEAGSGKSGIALRLGQTLAKNGMPVLFLRATDFPNNQDPVTIIQHRIALSFPLMDAFARLGKERQFAVIVDQLDTVVGTDLCKYLVSFLKVVAGIPKAKVLAVSRTHEYLNDPDISGLEFQTIESGRLTDEQALEYLMDLGVSTPHPTIVELACNLLNLSLIADVIALNPEKMKNTVDEVGLWRQFFTTIQHREGDEAADFALELARKTMSGGERRFVVQFPKVSVRRKLLSRGILVESPGRRYVFRHEQLQDFLCAYALLSEQPNLLQLINEFGNNLSKGMLNWLYLLYHVDCPEVEPIFINDILDAKDKLPFYTRIQVLESLKLELAPSDSVARVVSKHLIDRAYQQMFFGNLDRLEWVRPLYEASFFYKPPNPIEIEPGSFQIPAWPAGEYLARFADKYEEIVIDVVKSTKTENWRVQEILVDALMKISPESAASLVSCVDTWLDGRFSRMLPIKLASLADHLRQAGLVDTTLEVFESVIKPVLPPKTSEYSKYYPPIRFRSDHYWVNEYCVNQLPILISRDPIGVVAIFERHLIRTIELVNLVNPGDADVLIGRVWRPHIPSRLSERGDVETLDVLIDGLRDGLDAVCERLTENGEILLKKYLSNKHLVFQRIALFTLRSYGQNYTALLDQAFLQRDYLETIGYTNEYRGLMRNQFANASDEVRKQVIAWITSGPQDLDSRAINHAAWQNRDATDDDRRLIREDWTLDHLEIIRDHLSGDTLELLNKLVALHGRPDTEEKPPLVTTSWGGAPSPVSADELAKKSFEEIKHLFLTYVPDDLFLNPRESLAQTLQGLVRNDPGRYGEFAAHLIDPAVRFVYIHHYLSGFRESLKNSAGKIGDAIVALCEYVVTQNEDPFEESAGRHEPGLITAQLEVAQLLEGALHSDDPYITREQMDRIRSLLITLAHHPDPELEDDANSNFDPYTHSLNCVRGVAMHGIMQYSLYVIRQQGKFRSEKYKVGYLEPEIQKVLEEKLDLTTEPSPAVHAVYGAFIPQLHFLSHEWLGENLSEIFLDDEDKTLYWKAAWDAYIFASKLYWDVFILLVPQYQRGVQLLNKPQEGKKPLGGSPNERLAQHLMAAYLSDLTDFGHDNALLDTFFSNAPDPIRANGIFWLSQVLGNQKPTDQDTLWSKCWTMWQNRLRFAETEETSRNKQEISEYVRWLENCPVALDILYPALCQTVKYLDQGFEARELISYVTERCEGLPLEAVTLLKMTILSAKEPWWAPKEEDEEEILRKAMASGNGEARRIAIEVINLRGEQGNFRWRYLLE